MSGKPGAMCPALTAALAAVCLVAGMIGAPGRAGAQTLERMQQIIEEQQAQLDAQARALEELRQQVRAMSERQAAAGQVVDREDTTAPVAPETIPVQTSEKVAIEIYGQVNRAFLASDDGDGTDYFFVDNDSSSSRVGLLGEVAVNEDLTIGTRIEIEYQSNPSNLVSQLDEDIDAGDGAGFDERWVDAQLTSKRFGKLYLGKGSTASDGTSEVDLSGTSVVGYSDVGVMGGGILFFDDDAGALSGTDIGDVFANFDGLSRRNRVRYDTPEFMGFTLSGSILSDSWDVALQYAAEWGDDWKFAAAVAYADADAISDAIDDQYNGSASILHSSGLNFTVAAGMRELDDSSRDDPMFYYGKVGYRAKFFEVGETRFSVDGMWTEDQVQDDDEGTMLGFQVVQDFADFGTEYYLGARWHELDRDDADLEDIKALMTGVRVKF